MAAGSPNSLWIERRRGDTRLAPADSQGPSGQVIVVQDHAPWYSGMRLEGRIIEVDHRNGWAWLDLPTIQETGFLNLNRQQALREGERLPVTILSERDEAQKALPVQLATDSCDRAKPSQAADWLARIRQRFAWESLPLYEVQPHDSEARQALDRAETRAARETIPLTQGRVLIDQTRAGWMLDVNGSAALATNQEAARAIAQAIRCANLAGLLVIDFLPLPDKAGRRAVRDTLAAGLASDPLQQDVGMMDHRGIVVVHRQRWGESLIELINRPDSAALASLRSWEAVLRAGARGRFRLTALPSLLPWPKPLAESIAAQWSVTLEWRSPQAAAPLSWSQA